MGWGKQVRTDRNASLRVARERQTRGQEKRERGSAYRANRGLADSRKCRRDRKSLIVTRPASIGGKRPDIAIPEALHASSPGIVT